MKIRKATKEDIAEIKNLCISTILEVNKKDYTQEEVEDWASCGESVLKWEQRLEEQEYWLCETDGQIVGLGSLKDGSHVGSFFVHKDFQRKGVGTLIMNKLINDARVYEVTKMDSEVSITAKPFFESKGFYVVKKQLAKANKMHLINFVMEKEL